MTSSCRGIVIDLKEAARQLTGRACDKTERGSNPQIGRQMNEIKLGAIIHRAATTGILYTSSVAVPVVAAHDMFPGQHVGFVGEGKELVGREPK